MATKRTILLQLDLDPHPSVFDRVTATDAGAECIFSYGSVTPENVRELVHGAMFTRGPDDLKNTAIFIGGSDVGRGEEVLRVVRETFFGPLSVSVMLDCGGANTTAAAAVLLSARHLSLSDTTALVLGGTGPVGQRVARLLARQGAKVRLGSRSVERAAAVAASLSAAVDGAVVDGVATEGEAALASSLDGVELVVAAGKLGVCLLPLEARRAAGSLKLAVDLNAVAPAGVEGVKSGDSGKERDGVLAYGPIGVGGFKMKIHRRAVARLFEANDHLLDAEEIYDIGRELG